MLHGKTSLVGDFTVGGVKKIQSGKLHHHSYLFCSKSVLIKISVSVFQSQFYKMKVCVFLKTTVSDKETVPSFLLTFLQH
jgi:hypothetical protein